MSIWFWAGALCVLALVVFLGIYSGRKVKTAEDFVTGGKTAGSFTVAGSLIGTLVGGASTIGTAQAAFSYGLSAWWFTLGGGLGCLLLLWPFSKPLYSSSIQTMPQILLREYGKRACTLAAVLVSAGSFFSILSQTLAGVALLTSVSNCTPALALAAVFCLMLCYVLFGGVLGAGLVGMVKIVLLCAFVGICGIMAFSAGGGFQGLSGVLPASYFNIFSRGVGVDLGSGLSLMIGVIASQSYIQAILAAKNYACSKKGLALSVFLTPLIGLGGVFVGLYMKAAHPEIAPAMALPLFILEKTPPWVAGMMIATLLVALIGTGAGMALGISTMVCKDIYRAYGKKAYSQKKELLIFRAVLLAVLLAGCLVSVGNLKSLILKWSYMSMGLRGAVAFFPLCAALFMPGRIREPFVLAALLAGPGAVFLGNLICPAWLDPLFVGMAISLICLAAGLSKGKKQLV